MGLLLAAELHDGIDARVAVAKCIAGGLVVNAVTPTAIRFAPPFTLTSEQIDEALGILSTAIAETIAEAGES